MTNSNLHHWSWREACNLLATDVNKRLNIKLLDTVFFEVHNSKSKGNDPKNYYETKKNGLVVSSWLFTSKRGNIVKRKKPRTLTLRHIYERFYKCALANSSNARGPRIICVFNGRAKSSTTATHLTVEQLEREVKHHEGGDSSLLQQILQKEIHSSLQCYLQPYRGIDQVFRVVITRSLRNETSKSGLLKQCTLDVYCIKDSVNGSHDASLAQIEDIKNNEEFRNITNELNTTVGNIVEHLELQLMSSEIMNQQIMNMSADFILDDNLQLWLCKIPQLVTNTILSSNEQGINVKIKSIGDASTSSRAQTPPFDSMPFTSKIKTSLSRPLSATTSKLPLMESHTAIDKTKKQTSGISIFPMSGPPHEKENVKKLNEGLTKLQRKVAHHTPSNLSTSSRQFKSEKLGQQVPAFISNAEHEFMFRNHIEAPKYEDVAKDMIINLKEQIIEMETKVKRAKKIVMISAQTADEERNKSKFLQQTLSSLKQQFDRNMQIKDDEYSRLILHYKSQLNSSKAEIARFKSSVSTQGQSSRAKDSQESDFHNKSDVEETLLMKIQSLHQEIMFSQRKWGEEKRSIVSAHSAVQQKKAAKHREDLSEHRAKIAAMEDEAASQKDRFMELEKEKIVLMKKINDSSQKNDHLSNVVSDLRSEVKLMKQSLSLAQSNSLVSDGSSPQHKGGENKQKSTMEAEIQTLKNKVDYLKAQLASEATLKSEYTNNISRLQTEKEQLLVDNRSRIRALEEDKDKEILQIQEQLREIMERPLEDVSILEGKIATLQVQLGDSVQDISRARKKEEIARSDFMREQKRLRALQKDFAAVRVENESIREEIRLLRESKNDESTNEAMLRRLDNERRYLKNQLQNEVNIKKELAIKLELSEQEFKESKNASSAEIESLETKMRKEKEELSEKQQALMSKNQVLQAEVDVQNEQLSEIKQAYTKVRDQLRLDQVSTEQLRATCQRLSEELKAAQDEVLHSRAVGDAAIARHSESTQAISTSIKRSEAARVKEIAAIQMEMQKVLQESSETQQKMIKLRDETEGYRKNMVKIRAAEEIGKIFIRMQLLRKLSAFMKWAKQTETSKSIARVMKKNADSMQISNERMKKQYEAKLRDVVTKLKHEYDDYIVRLKKAAEEERLKLQEFAKMERKNGGELQKEQMMRLFEERENEVKSIHQAKIIQIENESKRIKEILQLEHKREIDAALNKARQNFQSEKNMFLEANNKKWSVKMEEREKGLILEMENALSEANRHYKTQLDEHKHEFDTERKEFTIAVEEKIEKAIQKETERMQVVSSNAVQKCEEEWKTQLNKTLEQQASDIAKLKESHAHELQVKGIEFENVLKNKQEEWKMHQESTISSSIKAAVENEKVLREKAVELEAQKWKNSLLEVEKRLESEHKTYYQRGYDEREAKAIKEKEDLEEAANSALEKVKESAKDNLRETLEKTAEQLKLARDRAKTEKEEEISRIVQQLNQENNQKLDELKEEKAKESQKEKEIILNQAKIMQDKAVREVEEREKSFSHRLETELNNETEKRRKAEDFCASRIEEIKRFAEDEIMRRVSDAEKHAKKMIVEKETEMQNSFRWEQSEREKQHKQEIVDTQEKCRKETEDIADEIRKRSEDAIENVVKELEIEHKRQIEELKHTSNDNKRAHNETKSKLCEAESCIQEYKSKFENMVQNCQDLQKKSSLRLMEVIAKGITQHDSLTKELRIKDSDIANAIKLLKAEASSEKKQLECRINGMEEKINMHKTRQQQMYNTLVNHKREILLQQKKESLVVSGDLEQIGSKRSELEAHRKQLEFQMTKMEKGVREVERQIQLHSAVSAVQDGRVNIAHARKKRRMDEEYEQLLENIELKREQIGKTDIKLKEIIEKKEEADDKMKMLERTLVEVLVEQQKKLLGILTNKDVI